MANEFTFTDELQLVKGNTDVKLDDGLVNFTQSGTGGPYPGDTPVTHTVEKVVALTPTLTTPGFVRLRNNDATNSVKWGFATGVYGGLLLPGMACTIYLNAGQTSLYFLANVATCRVFVGGFEA